MILSTQAAIVATFDWPASGRKAREAVAI